jgi:5-methylcytosine-specific restriction endonuclease McrA
MVDPASPEFLLTYEWRKLRMEVLKRDGARCQCCGASAASGATMVVDHIKPRRTHPELALDADNCQTLCTICNHGKGNWDMTNWRERKA